MHGLSPGLEVVVGFAHLPLPLGPVVVRGIKRKTAFDMMRLAGWVEENLAADVSAAELPSNRELEEINNPDKKAKRDGERYRAFVSNIQERVFEWAMSVDKESRVRAMVLLVAAGLLVTGGQATLLGYGPDIRIIE